MVKLSIAYSAFKFLALCFYHDYMYIERIGGLCEDALRAVSDTIGVQACV